MEASREELYRRQLRRNDHRIDDFTMAKFLDYLKFDEDMGLLQIRDEADYVLDSNAIILQAVLDCLLLHGYIIEL